MYGVNFQVKYPSLYLLASLTAGILCRDILHIPVVCFYSFVLAAFLALHQLRFYRYGSFLLLAGIFCYGSFSSSPDGFQPEPGALYTFQGRCEEVLPHRHYIVSAQKQRYYLSGYTTSLLLQPGDSFSCTTRFIPLRVTVNPGQFSYDHYLKQKEVSYKLQPVQDLKSQGHSSHILYFFNGLRDRLIRKTALLLRDTVSQSLVNALCLGYKNDLSNETRDLFSETGTIHLLSVSGLHTGAVYLFILFFLRLFRLSGKRKQLAALPVLWAYALLTGLSPSVVRAATILSFISTGQAFNRTYLPLNAIAASAFITLLIRPALLYSVSFQLSYCAYTGILVLYPVLYRFIRLPKFLSGLYAACCVSVSAQLPVLGLTAYYFHNINLNGFLINPLAIPLASGLLYTSLFCLLLPLPVSHHLAFIPEKLAHYLLQLLRFYEPFSYNLKALYPSLSFILLVYAALVTTGLFFLFRQRFWLRFTAYLLLILLAGTCLENFRQSTRQEIIIFHHSRQSVILADYQGYYLLLHGQAADSSVWLPYVRQHRLCHLPAREFLSPALKWQAHQLTTPSDTLLIADRQLRKIPPSTVLIVTANLRPEMLLQDSLRKFPRQIICDGSNTLYTLRLWQTFCQLRHIPLRTTSGEGAIRLSLK